MFYLECKTLYILSKFLVLEISYGALSLLFPLTILQLRLKSWHSFPAIILIETKRYYYYYLVYVHYVCSRALISKINLYMTYIPTI